MISTYFLIKKKTFLNKILEIKAMIGPSGSPIVKLQINLSNIPFVTIFNIKNLDILKIYNIIGL